MCRAQEKNQRRDEAWSSRRWLDVFGLADHRFVQPPMVKVAFIGVVLMNAANCRLAYAIDQLTLSTNDGRNRRRHHHHNLHRRRHACRRNHRRRHRRRHGSRGDALR